MSSPIPLIDRPTCALCGSGLRTVHRAFRDIPVVRCKDCGFLYSSRIMPAESLQSYYADNFGSIRHLQGQRVNARTNAVVLQRLLDLKSAHSWLDIGTGYGFLLDWLEKVYGVEAEGIELSQQECEYARKELGLKVHDRLLSECGLKRNHYDVVTSFEVIEHIAEPIGFLTELAEYVKPGGWLIVMTDNFESTVVQELRGSFPKWIPHTHVSHFGPKSLRYSISQVPGVHLEKELSYTPWDLELRRMLSHAREPVQDDQAFNLDSALTTEMHRQYRLFWLRFTMNPLWTGATMQRGLDHGALMYAACRKEG
jgi:2-polyprenyl-3-methyl-5-hydroxy-6-metoxy-1,4-benzoquinol methylase